MSPPRGVAPPLRIVFFGTPAFAVPTLEHLIGSPHRVVGVVTQPDRPRGRGHHRSAGAVKHVALAHGLPLLQPDVMTDPAWLDTLGAWQPDLGVVAAYGHILSERVLTLPRLGMINVHASLLPAYRGAAPIQRAVMAGESETGVTIIRLVKALDAGPMLDRVSHPIGTDDTSDQIESALARIGAVLLLKVVDDLAAGTEVPIAQDGRFATHAPRLTKADGAIDWTQPARRVHDLIRGLHPWPHGFTYLDGTRIILLRSRIGADLDPPSSTTPGTIAVASADRLMVTCGDARAIAILELQLEGRNPLAARDFLSGHRITPGKVFTSTP